MSEKKSSQAQQDVPPNPVQGAADTWRQVTEAQMGRIQEFYDQLARYETDGAERAQAAVDEMARLTKEAIDHGARMAAEWRRLSLSAVQRSADLAGRAAR